jgi:hypothetical protein
MKSNSTQIIDVKPTPTPTANPPISAHPSQPPYPDSKHRRRPQHLRGPRTYFNRRKSATRIGHNGSVLSGTRNGKFSATPCWFQHNQQPRRSNAESGLVADPRNGYNPGVYSTINVYATATHP